MLQSDVPGDRRHGRERSKLMDDISRDKIDILQAHHVSSATAASQLTHVIIKRQTNVSNAFTTELIELAFIAPL